MAMDANTGRPIRHPRHLVIEQLNPWVLLTYYVAVIGCAMVFIHPVFLGTMLILMVGVNLVGRSGHRVLMTLEGSVFMVAFIMVLNPLVNNRGAHVIWTFGGVLITVEAVMYGLLMALSLVIVLLTFISYNQYLTSQKFMYLFSRFSPKLTLLTMMTLRFVPLFIKRFKGIIQAQSLRGIEVEQGGFRQRSISLVKLMAVLLEDSFDRALHTADAMSARGYASHKRTSFQRYRFTQRDLVWLLWLLLLSGSCFFEASQGIGRLVIYPSLGQMGLSVEGWLVLLEVAILVSFPMILEGWEWVWWHLLKHGI